jgi:hypothetical protein
MISSNPDLGGTLPDAWNNLLALTTVHLDDGNFTGVLVLIVTAPVLEETAMCTSGPVRCRYSACGFTKSTLEW